MIEYQLKEHLQTQTKLGSSEYEVWKIICKNAYTKANGVKKKKKFNQYVTIQKQLKEEKKHWTKKKGIIEETPIPF